MFIFWCDIKDSWFVEIFLVGIFAGKYLSNLALANRVRIGLYEWRQWRSGWTTTARVIEWACGRVWWGTVASGTTLVVQNGNANETLGRMRHIGHVGRLQFGGNLPFPFVATILKPDFYLCLGQAKRRGQTGSFRWTQVPEINGKIGDGLA